MTVTLGTNIASLQAQRRLFETGDRLTSVFERLASGQRINRASDDAAGLAIASSLNADARVFNQAVRNANDGISLLNIAEGALKETSGILVRLKELAIQSANGVYSREQRAALDEEADALTEEYNRVLASVDFNGVKLFSAEFEELVVQIGYGVNGSLQIGLGDEVKRQVGTGSFSGPFTLAETNFITRIQTADFNQDGFDDFIVGSPSAGDPVYLSNGDGTFSVINQTLLGNNQNLEVGDYNNDGILDIAGINNGGDTIQVSFGNGDGTFGAAISSSVLRDDVNTHRLAQGDFDEDGNLDIAYIIGGGSSTFIQLGNGDGTFQSGITIATNDFNNSSSILDIQVADLNGDEHLDILTAPGAGGGPVMLFHGQGDGTFQTGISINISAGYIAIEDVNGDGLNDIAAGGSTTVEVLLNQGDGTFVESFTGNGTQDRVHLADMNGDGHIDLISNPSGTETNISYGDGTGSFVVATTLSNGGGENAQTAIGDFNGDGVNDMVIPSTSSNVQVFLHQTEGSASLKALNLNSRVDALESLAVIEDAQTRTALEQGLIGSAQSRLQVAENVLRVSRENFIAAESQIKDVDVAKESSALVRNNILQQTAAAVLAQANQQPALVLQLLS